jgi:putative ABC transport system permease protein
MTLRTLLARVTNLLRGRRREQELDGEIEQHLEFLAQDHMRRGLSPPEARDAALRSFGGVDRIRSLTREQSGFRGLDDLVQDAKFALRLLIRNPRFAFGAILVLGLGIGINNMYFTLIYGHTMRGLPIEQPDRVLHVSAVGHRDANQPLSFPEFEDVRHARALSGAGAFAVAPMTLSEEDRAPDRYVGAFVSAAAFDIIGVAPIYGRGFSLTDDQQGAPAVVLINQRVWESRYGRDPAILGRSVRVDGVILTIVGIVPDRSGFPSTAEVWQPVGQMNGLDRMNRDARTLQVFGRVRDGVEVAAAAAEVEALVTRTDQGHSRNDEKVRGHVVPISQHFFGRPTDPAWIAFIAAATLVLVVSCANAANLMLARASLRARELAVRGSLGASRLRVVRQLLVESVVLAAIGGAVGCGVSIIGARFAQTFVPENALPYWLHYRMDVSVLVALIAVSLATILVFGLLPAMQASKTDVNEVLKAGGRSGTWARASSRWTTAFLTAQFGLTVILVAYAVADIQTRGPELRSDATIDAADLLSASVTLPRGQYQAPDDRLGFYRTVYERLGAIAGVSSLSIGSALPRRGATEIRLRLEGVQDGTDARVWTVSVGPRYFQTLGLSATVGREFVAADGLHGNGNVVVNQRFVELFSASKNPVGRRVRLSNPDASGIDGEWLTVVGVMPDIRHRDDVDPMVYLPLNQTASATVSVLIRTSGDQSPIIQRLRDEMRRVDPNLPLYRVMTMPQAIDEVAWVGEMSSHLARTLTIAALLLAVAGLYAVTATTVGQRSREIGLRMALGAQAWQVRRLIIRRAAIQVGLGLVFGILCTMAWDAAFFNDRSARDPSISRFASPAIVAPTAVLLAIVTLAACVVPVRRATRLDPVRVLRDE